MLTKFYALINAGVGRAPSVVKAAREFDGVVSADVVSGPFDVIVVCEAEDLVAAGRLLTDSLHRIPGVGATTTCVTVEAAPMTDPPYRETT